jgi:RHS repeat-associated protein
LPPAVSSAAYDQANRLTNWNGAAITYDANGNMLSDGTRTYAWDSRNRLISIAGPVAASFQYDALGRRIRKTVGGADTAYLYDGLNPVQELNGATPAANLLTGFNLDEFFRRTDSTGDRDIITDALGSTLALADSAGTIQTSYAYDPYGNTAQTGQASTNPFQYTGRENDETGLFYYRARYYSPQLQRFITSDPIGLKGGLNTYTYVRNNPLRWKDPRGLFDDGFPGMGNPLESWLNATNNYVSANPNLGDLFSDTNGNTSGDFRPQDGVCTMGPVSPIGNICVLERCQRHDACYDTSKCNASSWLPTLLGSGKSCPSCNRGFFNPLPASPAPSIDYVAP